MKKWKIFTPAADLGGSPDLHHHHPSKPGIIPMENHVAVKIVNHIRIKIINRRGLMYSDVICTNLNTGSEPDILDLSLNIVGFSLDLKLCL